MVIALLNYDALIFSITQANALLEEPLNRCEMPSENKWYCAQLAPLPACPSEPGAPTPFPTTPYPLTHHKRAGHKQPSLLLHLVIQQYSRG